MMKITPILIFTGQANQAIELYEKAFNAKVKEKLTYASMKADFGDGYKEEYKDLIGWSELKIGRQLISIADDYEAMQNKTTNTSSNAFLIDLLVHFDSDEEIKAAFELLTDGGVIKAPLHKQPYCSLTCALIDRFGGRWQLMSGYKG